MPLTPHGSWVTNLSCEMLRKPWITSLLHLYTGTVLTLTLRHLTMIQPVSLGQLSFNINTYSILTHRFNINVCCY